MNKENFIDGGCVLMSALFTATQTKEVLQIISFILTIISVLIVIIRNLINWYIDAKKDGKITAEEVKRGTDIIIDGVQKVNNVIDENKKKMDE
jgi:hypothetical protein|nr:MAG TPA: hypothetical protein [Caudoviricetes sp.]